MNRPLPNQPAPALSFDVLGVPEGHWDLRKAEPKTFSMLVFYRGLHCPVCKSYLQELESRFDSFWQLGVEPVALSMDPEDRAKRARGEWKLEKLPVGYGLGEDVARDWGLYMSEAISEKETRRFSEPGLFLVKPDRTLFYAAINSMPFGRPGIEDMHKAIAFVTKNDYPARGRLAA